MPDILTLYHGSSGIIETPEFGNGNPRNDYGFGFYCTENIELAKEWACFSRNGGFVNIYQINTSNLSVLELLPPAYNLVQWLAILVNNRIFDVSSPIASEARDYITEHFLPDINIYDTIKGYRADDSYFTFAADFLSNTISLKQLGRAMTFGSLGEQFVIKSQKAFTLLEYLKNEPVDGKVYFDKRQRRDKDAREQYLKRERNSARSSDDIFMIDIIREEMKCDDPRLQ